MLTLDATTQSLECFLGGAVATNELVVWVSYTDTTTTTFTPGSTRSLTNGATDVTILAAPSASTQRRVTNVTVYNADTAIATITLQRDESGTEYKIGSWALATGEQLQWTPDSGWFVCTAAGARKTALAASSQSSLVSVKNLVTLASDATSTSTSAANVGLSFTVVSGVTYAFSGLILFTAALTTTGIMVDFNGPSMTVIATGVDVSTANTAQTSKYLASITNGTAFTSSAFSGGNLARIYGIFTPSAAGTFDVRFATEVGSSAVVAKVGSYLEHWVTG